MSIASPMLETLPQIDLLLLNSNWVELDASDTLSSLYAWHLFDTLKTL